jgi:hypothetical protein
MKEAPLDTLLEYQFPLFEHYWHFDVSFAQSE